VLLLVNTFITGGNGAERLACWTQAHKSLGSNRSRDAVALYCKRHDGCEQFAYSLSQTIHTHRASFHQAAELVVALLALLRVARVTLGLAESKGSLPPGL